jgi:hypothetical protein
MLHIRIEIVQGDITDSAVVAQSLGSQSIGEVIRTMAVKSLAYIWATRRYRKEQLAVGRER